MNNNKFDLTRNLMRKRLEWQGGVEQENRMIADKFRTLQRVLKYSYQACTVAVVQPHNQCLLKDEETGNYTIPNYEVLDYRALINPNVVKQDYDDKIISIPYGSVQLGDVFEWRKTDVFEQQETDALGQPKINTKWIIYLEEITEDAYFRGAIRRCRYEIKFKDKEGKWCSTWAAIRGPVETQIESIQKNQERIDKPNLSLNILIPQNEKTLYAFDRYSEFLFADRCWKVQAPDSISMRNIIEINAEEDYINKDTDDIDEEIKNGLIFEPEDPTPNSGISGKTFIKPKQQEEYTVDKVGGCWSVAERCPVRLCSIDSNKVTVMWDEWLSGQFTLRWEKGNVTLKKVIVVQFGYRGGN